MNDFDYDAMQKKRIARGAYNRKGTVNRKGCTLPHEYLTKKEREAMNGEINTISLNAPISWERFKTLDTDVQTEYLQHQLNRFGIGISTIGKELFGLSKSALGMYVQEHNIRLTSRTGGRISRAAYESWQRWLDGEAKTAPVSETVEEPIKEETKSTSDQPVFRAHDFEDLFRECGMEREASEPPTPKEGSPVTYPTTGMTLKMKGTPIEILTSLSLSLPTLLDGEKTYRFTVNVDDYVL